MPFKRKPMRHSKGIREGHPLAVGMRMFLPFSENSGDVFGVTPSRHRAARNGDVAWQPGASGPEMYFPGTDDYLTIAHSDDFAVDDFTLACLVDPDNVAATGRLAYQYDAGSTDGYWLTTAAGGAGFYQWKLYVGGANVTCTTDAGAAASVPQMVLGRRLGPECAIYVDGAKQADTETLAGTIDSSDPIYVGCDRALGNDYAGAMGLLALWGQALSDSQIEWFTAEPWDVITPPSTRLITWGASLGAGNGNNGREMMLLKVA